MSQERCPTCGQWVESRRAADGSYQEMLVLEPGVRHRCDIARREEEDRQQRERAHHEALSRRNPDYHKECWRCGAPVMMIFLPERNRYEGRQPGTGLRHGCDPRAFQPRRANCTGCGAPVHFLRNRRSGQVRILEIDSKEEHRCRSRIRVRVVNGEVPVAEEPERNTGVSGAKAKPAVPSAPAAGDPRLCEACGKPLTAGGKYPSCPHCLT